ncbi:Signal recognition particle receptor, beta subunit (small G protein superfamily) [Phaffia rhodozyma]|uniref:Signal recognition particle receptor subunit beta n=1 Tax=Phaffia rhodozyma TaxID=264483 RepID=A0A0F7SSQ1_PHARH|nr:Signal recognition particle receptor, beta subunit (small G protein superfamily) [Phaffia rhodozyma]
MGKTLIQFPSSPAFVNALNDEETLLAFLGTIVLVLITAIYFVWSSTNDALERTIILVGPPGSGKTSVFAELAHGSRPATHSSLKPSTSHFILAPPKTSSSSSSTTGTKNKAQARKFKIIDYPGHPRLAQGLQDLLSREIRGKKRVAVVFVVDGAQSGREKEIGSVVDALLPILPHTLPPSPTPVLLLSTKLDLVPNSTTRSLAVPRLHTSLTRELNARKSALGSTSGKIDLLETDQDASGSASAGGSGGDGGIEQRESVEEVLRMGAPGSKWRWEDWKGISWAGGWTGKPVGVGLGRPAVGVGKEKEKASIVDVEDEEQDKEEKKKTKPDGEDGLQELKQWLWNLK